LSRKPLSKELLLPLPPSAAQTVALSNHLTFAACRAGAGSAYLFNELIQLVCVTFFVQDAGYGDTDVVIYARAEAALERGLERAEVERRWNLEAADLPLFEAVLQQADRQLAGAPRRSCPPRRATNRNRSTPRENPSSTPHCACVASVAQIE
jgi:hypothetical protein